MNYNEILSVAQVFIAYLPPINSRKHQPTEIIAGILMVLVTGMQWKNLSKPFPPKSTCYYWFRKLSDTNAWQEIYKKFLLLYSPIFKNHMETCAIDGSFVKATKGGTGIGYTKYGKGTKVMQIVDKYGLPLSLAVYPAGPHESRFTMATLSKIMLPLAPKYLLGDRAYDSDKLDILCKSNGVFLVANNKINRKKKTQDGRQARRLRGRYVVERTNAHIKNYRRVATRHERYLFLYENFVWMAHSVIFIRKFNLQKDMLAA